MSQTIQYFLFSIFSWPTCSPNNLSIIKVSHHFTVPCNIKYWPHRMEGVWEIFPTPKYPLICIIFVRRTYDWIGGVWIDGLLGSSTNHKDELVSPLECVTYSEYKWDTMIHTSCWSMGVIWIVMVESDWWKDGIIEALLP